MRKNRVQISVRISAEILLQRRNPTFDPSELKRLKHFLAPKFNNFLSEVEKCVELSLA